MKESDFDLAIIRTTMETEDEVSQLSRNIKPLLAPSCYVLFVKRAGFPLISESSSDDGSLEIIASPGTPNSLDDSHSTPQTAPDESDVDSEKGHFDDIAPLTTDLETSLGGTFPLKKSKLLAAAQELASTFEIIDGFESTAFLSRVETQETQVAPRRKLVLARFLENTPGLTPALRSCTESAGWSISEQTYPFSAVKADSAVLVLDELSSPIMVKANVKQWEGLKSLVNTGAVILWVTQGAQYQVSNPNTALAHGLFRVIRMEDANAKLVCLDVQYSTSPATHRAITEVLHSLRGEWPKKNIETECSEREGVIHVHRVIPDSEINDIKRQVAEGAEPVLKSLQNNPRPVSLRVERLGTFQSLTWCETEIAEVPVEAGRVEVEITAVGVNFKDVAVAMGIVPENEYTLGYEAAGTVKRLGPGVTKFAVGDRVCFLNNGSYANRLQVPTGRCHVIPDSMSFEDAATIPSVYLASMYSLFDIANLKKGQVRV